MGTTGRNRTPGTRAGEWLGSLRGRAGVLAFLIVAVPAASATAPAMRGWQPLVLLAGNGDARRAVGNLQKMSRVAELRLRHSEMDAATTRFVDAAMDEIEDMAIDDLYELLPENAGEWRRLRVWGRVAGKTYRIERPPSGPAFEMRKGGSRRDLGGFSLVVKAKPVVDRNDSEERNFLIRARAGLGIGPIGRPQMAAAAENMLRILGGTDLRAASPGTDARIAKHHRKLDAGERRVLAVGYDAFPAISALAERFGRVEDITIKRGDTAGSYHHVKLVFRIRPETMERYYEDLADFLDDLDELATLSISVTDAKHRRLLLARFATETLRGSLEFYVQDGHIIPSQRKGKKTTVFVNAPISLDEPQRLHAYTSIDVEVLGIEMHIKRLYTSLRYRPRGRGLTLDIAARKVPKISVGGAGLGFVPPGVIDLFIPSTLKQLATDFLSTALEGNHAKGLALDIVHEQPAEHANSTTQIHIGVEVLDNLLIEIGAQMFNDRLLPDEDETADIERAMWDGITAFRSDLKRYSATL